MNEEPDAAPEDAVIEAASPQPASPWRRIATFADRTAVLFIGIAVGTIIGGSFFGLRSAPASVPAVPVQIVAAPASQPAVQPGSSECAARFSGGLTRALADGRPLHIGVFGDSFGAGVTEGLALQFRGDKAWVVHGFSKQATGFTRYAKLDLLDDIKAKVDAQPIDIAVISFGANDTFDIYDDGIAKYMSPQWQEIVGKRVDAVIQLLRDRGAQVYWVGLPKMREPDFDVKVSEMNAFYAAHMRALGVPYYDTVPVSVDASGQYSAHLVDPKTGKSELARANDGVHMATGHAYALLTRGLVTRIRDYVALAQADVDRQASRRRQAH